MKRFALQTPALATAAFLMGSGLFLVPAYAADDATTAEAVQTLTDALTGAVTGSVATTAAGTESVTTDADDAAIEAASDAAAGLPKFNNRQERREYLRKLRDENPEQFKQVMQKRKEHFLANHPKAAERMEARRKWKAEHPGEKYPKRHDYRENRRDRREDFRDRREDKADKLEDIRDRREDRWDAKHDGGKWDKVEDRRDRREDVRDRQEDIRDRKEDRFDRRENRWDANHGPDRGRPGHPGRHYGQAKRDR